MQAFLKCAIAVLALSLASCQSTLQLAADTFGVDVVPETVQQKARKAAKVALTAWSGAILPGCETTAQPRRPAEECIGGLQKLIYEYGRLDPCGPDAPYICRSSKAWPFIQAKERQVSGVIASAEPLIDAEGGDVELLLSIPDAIYDAQAAIRGAMTAPQSVPDVPGMIAPPPPADDGAPSV